MLPFPESPASQGGCLPEAFLLFTTWGLPCSWKDYCTASLTARSGHFSALPVCCRSNNLKTEKSLNIWANGHLWSSGIHSPPCWSLLCWYDCCWPETFFLSHILSFSRIRETLKPLSSAKFLIYLLCTCCVPHYSRYNPPGQAVSAGSPHLVTRLWKLLGASSVLAPGPPQQTKNN